MWIESSLQSHRILFRGGVAFVLSKATKILGKFCEHKHKRLVFNIAVGFKCVHAATDTKYWNDIKTTLLMGIVKPC